MLASNELFVSKKFISFSPDFSRKNVPITLKLKVLKRQTNLQNKLLSKSSTPDADVIGLNGNI